MKGKIEFLLFIFATSNTHKHIMNFKIIIIALIVLFGLQTIAQTLNNTKADSNSRSKMLIGYCDKSGLEKGNFGISFKNEYSAYNPDKVYINKLAPKLKNIKITIVLATWCSDSKREVPRFYKVLNNAGFNDKFVSVIAVDRNKEADGLITKEMDIERVPTFIIYQNNKEIGRIIETPKRTLEKDLWKIVK